MKDFNEKLKEEMIKKSIEEYNRFYSTSTHGKISDGFLKHIDEMGSPEKPVLVQDFTDPIIELLKSKFDQRSLVGIKKYGTTLAENDTDDFLMHLLEEQMDSCAYLMKLIVDRENEKNSK